MQINAINNTTAFSGLHIKSNTTNRMVLDKCMNLNPDATKEALSDIDRESGDKKVYMYSGLVDGSNVDIIITDKNKNIMAARRIGLGNAEHFKIAFNRMVNQFISAVCTPKDVITPENKEVDKLLELYA